MTPFRGSYWQGVRPIHVYHIYPNFSDREDWGNKLGSDQMQQEQGLHRHSSSCFSGTHQVVKWTWSVVICLFVWFGLNIAFNNLSVISRRCLDVTGSSMLTFRVLPHWNIMPQTLWHDIPPSHIILTLSWPVPIPSERAASTIFKVFGMTRPGIEPATSLSQSGRSTTEPLCR